MLELLIALFLVAACALPLAQLPIKAAQEEFNCAYRMHAERLADLAFAKVKEKLYGQEISWEEICSPRGKGAQVFEDTVSVDIESQNVKKFIRRSTLLRRARKSKTGRSCASRRSKSRSYPATGSSNPSAQKKGLKRPGPSPTRSC